MTEKDKNFEGPIKYMFDKIIAPKIVGSEGIGTDNMTCIIVRFKDRITLPKKAPKP